MKHRPLPKYTPDYPLYGISNGHGGFWTHETFQSEGAAKRYMVRFWDGPGLVPSKHEIIPVRVTIEDARPAPQREGE